MVRRMLSFVLTVLGCIIGFALILGILMVIEDAQILDPIFSVVNQIVQVLIPAHSIFLAILVESFPFVFIGAILSSCVHEFIGEEQFAKWIPKNRLASVMVGGLVGFILPVCDCGTIPVARNLLGKGVPRATVIAFTLAAPVINPVTMLATYFAFGMNLHTMLIRVVSTFIIACTVGFLAGGSRKNMTKALFPSSAELSTTTESLPNEYGAGYKADTVGATGKTIGPRSTIETSVGANTGADIGTAHAGSKSKRNRLRAIMEHTVEEIFGIVGFLICSAAISSLYQVYHTQHGHMLQAHSGVIAVLTMMLLAVLFSLCSSADAFVARSFSASYSPGAVLAFMLIGQMADLRNLLLIPKTYGLKTGVKVIGLSFVFCLCAGLIL